MERPYVEPPPPPRAPEPAPPMPRAPNPVRVLLGALAILVLACAVPLLATLVLWGILRSFGVPAPFLPTLGATVAALGLYVIHIAVLARAVRPLVKE